VTSSPAFSDAVWFGNVSPNYTIAVANTAERPGEDKPPTAVADDEI
jgi:hypothetical protein